MKRPIRLTERDLSRIVRRVIKENEEEGNDTRYSRPKDFQPGFVPRSDDEMSPMGKTFGEIRRQAPKVNAELVSSGQGNETDAAFLNELMIDKKGDIPDPLAKKLYFLLVLNSFK